MAGVLDLLQLSMDEDSWGGVPRGYIPRNPLGEPLNPP